MIMVNIILCSNKFYLAVRTSSLERAVKSCVNSPLLTLDEMFSVFILARHTLFANLKENFLSAV